MEYPYFSDRSKRRSYIRRKITKVKDAMVKALREKSYIHFMEDCFNGNFPWKSKDGIISDGIPGEIILS